MGSSRFVFVALVAALLALPGGGSGQVEGVVPPATIASPSAPLEPPLVTWEDLRRQPAQHLARRVRLIVQLHGEVASWNPYLSRFGPRDHQAFRAWSDEQLPWQLEDFEAPAARFFVRRASPGALFLEGLPVYARCELVVRVAELFAGEPWIEVESVRRLEHHLTEGTVIHAGRAHEFLGEAQWQLAESELERALAGAVPEFARAELERLLALARAERENARAPRTGPTKQP